MKRKIVFYKEFNEVINKLPYDDKEQIKKAINIYSSTYNKPKLEGYLDAFFEYVKPANINYIQVSRRRYQAAQLIKRANECHSYRNRMCKKILTSYNIPKYCFYCGNENSLCSDHKIPRCNGGKDIIDNLVYACRSCNSQKGVKSFEDYRKYLEKLVRLPVIFFGEVENGSL